jgi:hypothetical protein
MGQYSLTYRIGQTSMAVGLSAPAEFVPPAGCNGLWFKIHSGAGTLSIANGMSALWSATFYPIGANEIVSAVGPAKYYLAAASATMIVSVGLSYTSGGGSGGGSIIAGG